MAFIDGHRDRWSVAAMCRVLEFSQRTYYAAKARPVSSRSLADEEHKTQIRRVWENNYQVYGPRRVWKQLHREGHPIARCRVERLMADMGIHGVQRGKRRFTTTPDNNAARAARPGRPQVRGEATERALAGRSHLLLDVGRFINKSYVQTAQWRSP